MPNILGASRTKTRNFEVCRLSLTSNIKNANPNLVYNINWYLGGHLDYQQYFQRTERGIFLFIEQPTSLKDGKGYHIDFNKVDLSYGTRYQFTCPICSKAARILYLKRNCFICRSCIGVTYESTHGSDLDRLATKVSKKRIKTFGKTLIDTFKPNVFESSDWLPKPKYAHNNLFENRLKELAFCEHKLENEIRRREWNLYL
jgi:hypothetical protein